MSGFEAQAKHTEFFSFSEHRSVAEFDSDEGGLEDSFNGNASLGSVDAFEIEAEFGLKLSQEESESSEKKQSQDVASFQEVTWADFRDVFTDMEGDVSEFVGFDLMDDELDLLHQPSMERSDAWKIPSSQSSANAAVPALKNSTNGGIRELSTSNRKSLVEDCANTFTWAFAPDPLVAPGANQGGNFDAADVVSIPSITPADDWLARERFRGKTDGTESIGDSSLSSMRAANGSFCWPSYPQQKQKQKQKTNKKTQEKPPLGRSIVCSAKRPPKSPSKRKSQGTAFTTASVSPPPPPVPPSAPPKDERMCEHAELTADCDDPAVLVENAMRQVRGDVTTADGTDAIHLLRHAWNLNVEARIGQIAQNRNRFATNNFILALNSCSSGGLQATQARNGDLG